MEKPTEEPNKKAKPKEKAGKGDDESGGSDSAAMPETYAILIDIDALNMLREQKGWNWGTLFKEAGISRNQGLGIKTNNPKVGGRLNTEHIDKLCLALGCHPTHITKWHPKYGTREGFKETVANIPQVDITLLVECYERVRMELFTKHNIDIRVKENLSEHKWRIVELYRKMMKTRQAQAQLEQRQLNELVSDMFAVDESGNLVKH